MKVLITGGMGVMGAETSRRFVKEGYRPIIFAATAMTRSFATSWTRSTSSSATSSICPASWT